MRAALTAFTEESVVAFTNAAFKCAHTVALGRFLLIHVTFAFAFTIAQHFQIHRKSFVDTDLQKKKRINYYKVDR